MSTIFTSVLLLGCLLYCTSDIGQEHRIHIYKAAFPLRGGVKGSAGGNNFLLLPRSVALLRMRQLREQQAANTQQEELGAGAVRLAVNRSDDGHNETLSRAKTPGYVNAELNEDELGRNLISEFFSKPLVRESKKTSHSTVAAINSSIAVNWLETMSKHVKSAWIMERSFLALKNIFQNQNNVDTFVENGLMDLIDRVLSSHADRPEVIAVGLDTLRIIFENSPPSRRTFLGSMGLGAVFRATSKDTEETRLIPRVLDVLLLLKDDLQFTATSDIQKFSRAFEGILSSSRHDRETLNCAARLLYEIHMLHDDVFFDFHDETSSIIVELYRSSKTEEERFQHVVLMSAVLNASTSSVVTCEVHELLQEIAEAGGQQGALARCCLSMTCVKEYLGGQREVLEEKKFGGMNSLDLLARLTMEGEEAEGDGDGGEEGEEGEGEQEEQKDGEEGDKFELGESQTLSVKETETDQLSCEDKADEAVGSNHELFDMPSRDSDSEDGSSGLFQGNNDGQEEFGREPLALQEDGQWTGGEGREGGGRSEWIEVQLDDLFQSPQDFSYAHCSYDFVDHPHLHEMGREEMLNFEGGGGAGGAGGGAGGAGGGAGEEIPLMTGAVFQSRPGQSTDAQEAISSPRRSGGKRSKPAAELSGDQLLKRPDFAACLEKLIRKFQLKNLRLESQRKGRRGKQMQETDKAKKLRILRQVTDFLFRIERAHWEYLDQHRKDNPRLPSLRFASFAKHVFLRIPMLAPLSKMEDIGTLLKHFSRVKAGTRSCGAIILNPSCDKCVLVRGFKSSAFGWPKGKVEHWESDATCAIREVQEEVGLDISSLLNETDSISLKLQHKDTNGITTRSVLRLFIIRPVSEDTPLCCTTKNEISEIRWFDVNQLPSGSSLVGRKADNSFWLVPPVVKSLRHWLRVKAPRG